MQSSKLYSDIVEEPSETDLWHQYNVRELIGFTFKTAGNNVANFKMLQIVLYLMAHQLNILEQVVEIKEQDISKAIEEQQQYMASDIDSSSIDKPISLEASISSFGDKNKSEAKKHLKSAKRKPSDITLTVDDSKHDRKETRIKKMKPKEIVIDDDDDESLGGSKHSGEGETKTEMITQSVQSKREEKYDDDDETLTLDNESSKVRLESSKDKTERKKKKESKEDSKTEAKKRKKEVKGKDNMATQTRERQLADASILDESEDDEIETDKKEREREGEGEGEEEHKMRYKQEKRQKPDDTHDTYESENYEKRADKQVKSKTSKADDNDIFSNEFEETKSIRSQSSVESVTSDESEDDEIMLDKKSKESLEVKTKEDKTAHSTQSYSGKQPDESKSEAAHEQGKKSSDTYTSVGSQYRQSSIELATRSQLEVLASNVKKLLQQTGPVPMPTMPDNKTLKDDLAKGSALLPEAMEAMQINARVIAAEEALTRMADLLNQLTAVGVLPPETLNLDTQSQEEHDGEGIGKPDDFSSLAKTSSFATQAEASTFATQAKASTFATQAESAASARAFRRNVLITRADMIAAVEQSNADMLKEINALTTKTWTSIEKANIVTTTIGENLDTITTIDDRISVLASISADYADQLNGFNTGLTTQLKSLQEQMFQFDTELRDGLTVFNMYDKKENSGVMELRKGYDTMMTDVNQIITMQKEFIKMKEIFTADLKNALEGVEGLIEQKADWDEVVDGLRDKVNTDQLQGIPDEHAFEMIRSLLSRQIQLCSSKFKKQNFKWSNAINDVTEILANKAKVKEVLAVQNFAKSSFKELRQQLKELETMLGLPKAAIIIKRIQRDGLAGPSTVPDLVEPSEKHYSQPTPTPALSIQEEPVDVAKQGEEPCLATVKIPGLSKIREHVCKRWVGGSHTMVTEHTTHENVSPSLQQKTPTRQYAGIGVDGRTYLLEEDLQPCIECNDILSHTYDTEELPLDQAGPIIIEVGGGDQNLVDDDQDKKV